MKTAELKAFECGVEVTSWTRVVHAATRSKARYAYWSDVREPWPDITIMQVTVRSLGAPQQTERFAHTARYRGLSYAQPGTRVIVDGDRKAQLCDTVSGANFVVMYCDGELAGKTGIYHPSEIIFPEPPK